MSCDTSPAEAKKCSSIEHSHCCMQGCSSVMNDRCQPFCLGCFDDLDGSFVSNSRTPRAFALADVPKDVESLSQMITAVPSAKSTCDNFITCTNALCSSFHCAEFGCARSLCRTCVRSCDNVPLRTVLRDDPDKFANFRCQFHCINVGHREAFMSATIPGGNMSCSLISPMPNCSNFAHRHCADVCLGDIDHMSPFCRFCCGQSDCGHCIVNHCSGEADCELHGVVSSLGNPFGFGKQIKKNISNPKTFSLRLFDPLLSFKSTFVATNFVEDYSVPMLAFGVMLKLGFVPDEKTKDIMCNVCNLTVGNANAHQLRIKFLMDMFVEATSHLPFRSSSWGVVFNVLVVYFAAKYSPNMHLIVKGEYPIRYASQDMDDASRCEPFPSNFCMTQLVDLITAKAYGIDYKIVNASIREMSVGQIMMTAKGARHIGGLDFTVPSSAMHHLTPMIGTTRETPQRYSPAPDSLSVKVRSRDECFKAFSSLVYLLHGKNMKLDDDVDDFDDPIEIPLSLLNDPEIQWDEFMTESDEQIRTNFAYKGVR